MAVGYSEGDRYVFLADSCAEGSVLRRKNEESKWENIAFGYYPIRISAGWDFGNIAVMMVPYAYSNRGVYFSFHADDNPSQVNWQPRWFGLLMNSTTDLEVIQNSIGGLGEHIKAFVVRGDLDLVTDQKIFKTYDSGLNWQPQTDGIRDNFEFADIEIYQNSPDYITTCGMRVEQSGNTIPIVCHSSDEGVTWSVIGDEASFNEPVDGVAFKVAMSKKEVVYVSMKTSRDYSVYSHQIWKTTDTGQTWERKWEEVDDNSVNQICNMIIGNANPDTPPSADTIIISLRERGILCSTDGGDQWQYRNNGLCSFSRTFALGQDPRNANRLFAGPMGAPFQTNDLGILWYDIANGSFPDKVTSIAKNATLLFSGAYDNTRVTISEDDLKTRTQVHGRYNYRVHNIKFEPYRPGYLWAISSNDFGDHSLSEVIFTNDAAQSCNNWNTALLTIEYDIGSLLSQRCIWGLL